MPGRVSWYFFSEGQRKISTRAIAFIDFVGIFQQQTRNILSTVGEKF